MRRLRLTPESEEYVAEWGITAKGEDRERIAQVLETFADGSWETHWWADELAGDPDIIELRPDDGLYLHMRLLLDEDQHDWSAEIISLYRDQPSHGDECA